jgi:protein-glutamine gamma-glutamyltransferase
MYLIRDRHAHAWAQVWKDDHWEDVDTTPGSWWREEESRASSFERVSDLISELRFRFLQWRWLGGDHWLRQARLWIVPPLVILLSSRLFRKRKRVELTTNGDPLAQVRTAESNFEFHRIERHLSAAAGARPIGEPLSKWLRDLPPSLLTEQGREELELLLELHYRERFDPPGLSSAERAKVRRDVDRWLDRKHCK